jgi:tetratricopeptide (TPR) repeat protein
LKTRSRISFIAALLLLLAGCASAPTQTPATPGMPELFPQETPAGEPEEGAIVEAVPPPVMSRNQAVIALLDRARIDTGAGRRESAGASLERALRIEPRNAWLWYELAQLRLAQGQYAQAISLARKSISFAARDRRLLALDWRVIGNARVAQGNPSGALQAFERAAELEQSVRLETDHGY